MVSRSIVLKRVFSNTNNDNYVRPHNSRISSSVKAYDRDVLILWNKFKELFDAERKSTIILNSLSETYCKIKSEINSLGKGTISAPTVQNFYKQSQG